MEEDGTHTHDKERIVKRCVEFYEELYRSRRASADQDSHDDPTTTSTIDPPSILPSEVEASIKRLKRNKAPGEDNITGGILQDGGDGYDPSSHWSIQHMSASSTGPQSMEECSNCLDT